MAIVLVGHSLPGMNWKIAEISWERSDEPAV